MSPQHTVARVLERLVLLLSCVILAISALSAGAVVYIRHEVTTMATRFTPLIDGSSRMRVAITDAQSEYRGYLLTKDRMYLERYRADREEFRRETAEFRELAGGDVGAEAMDELVDAGDRWFAGVDVQVTRVAEGREGDISSTAATFDRVEVAHDDLVEEVSAAREERRDRYRAAMSISLVAIILASLVALSATLRQSWKVRRYLISPLRSLYSTVVNHEAGAVAARADTTRGAQEVRAVATAFNSLAEVNDSMRRERERQLDLYRLTSRVVGQLSRRDDDADGTWDDACRELSARLGVDATTIYDRGRRHRHRRQLPLAVGRLHPAARRHLRAVAARDARGRPRPLRPHAGRDLRPLPRPARRHRRPPRGAGLGAAPARRLRRGRRHPVDRRDA